ncbi:MAG: hypothetical protein WKF96_23450, partial [Solirubrobacteraceae bacterium]
MRRERQSNTRQTLALDETRSSALPSTSPLLFEDERAYPHYGCANLRAGPVELSGRSRLLGVAGGAECGLDAAGEVV